jgi:glycosyltransferase involved in cell wall biosynthesis
MVAMWNDIKRHHLLFKALRDMKDPSYRVCLVGGPWGLVLDDIKDLAAHYGVIDNIEFFERVPPEQVNLLLNKSKVNLLLSLKEGGNKAIIEGLFANVPAIVLDEHVGIDLAWINAKTGILTDKKHLKGALLQMRSSYRSFHPRQWAIDNISCHASTRNLESRLKEIAALHDEPWTTSIRKKVNRPECEYYEESMRLPPFDLENYRIIDVEQGTCERK